MDIVFIKGFMSGRPGLLPPFLGFLRVSAERGENRESCRCRGCGLLGMPWLAGLLLLQGVHGTAEQWKGDDSPLWSHFVPLTALAGFVIGCCFVRVIKTVRQD